MKINFLFIPILILISGCNDFYHLKYTKLNKIPAHPEWMVKTSDFELQKNSKFQANISPGKYNSVTVKQVAANSISLVESKEFNCVTLKKKSLNGRKSTQIKHQSLSPFSNKLKEIKKRKGGDSDEFWLMMIMFFSLLFVIGGIWMLIAGIVAGTIWMIICGPIIFLIGLPFFIGFLILAFGDHIEKPTQAPNRQ